MNTSFGETLRNAREAKGLTTSQIAAKTRMLVQIVEEMENEDFHRIAAPIYGRGFVKLYAECVDLDPMPLVKEFMEIYEGRRAPIVRTREVPVQAPPPEPQPIVATDPEPAAEPVPEPPPVVVPAYSQPEPAQEPQPVDEPAVSTAEPTTEPPQAPDTPIEPPQAPTATAEPQSEQAAEPSPVVRGLELFEAQATQQPQSAKAAPAPTAGVASQPPATNVADIFSGSPYLSTESSYSAEGPSAADRFRKSLSSVSHGVIQSVREIPRSFWRISILSAAIIVLLAALAWGCMKLYSATSIKPVRQPQSIDTAQSPNDINDPKSPKAAEDLKKPEAQKSIANSRPKAGNGPEPAAPQAAGKTPALRSTGQKVPPLYAD